MFVEGEKNKCDGGEEKSDYAIFQLGLDLV